MTKVTVKATIRVVNSESVISDKNLCVRPCVSQKSVDGWRRHGKRLSSSGSKKSVGKVEIFDSLDGDLCVFRSF